MRHAPFSSIWRYDGISSQSVLLVRFVKSLHDRFGLALHHAQGLENTAAGVRRNPSHPLWWDGAVAAFLQQAPTALADPEPHQSSPTPCRLSSLRSDSGLAVRHHGRIATHQQDRDSAVQRSLPLLARSLLLSRSDYPAPIPQAAHPPGHPPTGRPARPTSSSIVPFTQTANHPHLRSRFGSTDRLWETAICSCRLQPQETGPTFLPPPHLLRGSFARVLARFSAAWQYRDGHRLGGLCQTLFRESALLHRLVPCPRPGGFRMLREAAGGTPRYTRVWLRRGGQGVLHHQNPRPQLSISAGRLGVGGWGVPLSTPPLESPPPLCGGATSHPPGPGRSPAIDALQKTENMPTTFWSPI